MISRGSEEWKVGGWCRERLHVRRTEILRGLKVENVVDFDPGTS